GERDQHDAGDGESHPPPTGNRRRVARDPRRGEDNAEDDEERRGAADTGRGDRRAEDDRRSSPRERRVLPSTDEEYRHRRGDERAHMKRHRQRDQVRDNDQPTAFARSPREIRGSDRRKG